MYVKNEQHFTESDFINLKPIPNKYHPGMGFDYGEGSCLMLRHDTNRYLEEHNLSPDHVWSVIEAEDELYLSHGFRFVNVLGFIITEQPPRFTPHEDILID